MRMKKSQLKEAVKAVVRECLNERHMKEGCNGGKGHLSGGKKGERMFKHVKQGYKGEKSPEEAERIAAATVNKNLDQEGADVVAGEGTESNAVLDKVVKFAIRKLPGYDAETLAKTAGDLFTGITGGQTLDPSVVAAAVQKHTKASDTLENPSECGTMQDEAGMTSETGEEPEEMPSIGISGEEPHIDVPGAEGEEHGYDEQEEIKLIKVMKLIADKLAAMHAGQPGAEPSEEPSAPPFGGGEEEPEEPSAPPFGGGEEEPEEPSEEPGEDNDEPFEKSKEEPEGDKEEDESPVKEAAYKQVAPRAATDAKENKALRIQTEPKVNETKVNMKMGPSYKVQPNPTAQVTEPDQPARLKQFVPKMTENHKVQKRSYATSNDGPQDPDNVRDPEVPQA